MEFDRNTRTQLALSGGIIGGLFAFLAIYNVGAFIGNDKPFAYIVALVASFCVICIGTNVFSELLEIREK
ncbi:MAG: hypothetical protein HYX67_02610 [Candidatus Melainabacteria bacterium]|nr:hypothetical protein [Candidatus Melainabacteria bacterium]